MKKSILALSVALTLAGCGSDGGDDSASITTPDVSTSANELLAKMAAVNITVNNDASICSEYGGGVGTVLRTDHFVVGVKDTGVTDAMLKKAASSTQVAFNDLLALTKLDAKTDLHIDQENPWLVCVDSKETGNGTGFVNAFEYSPKDDVSENYRLAKHELTHTVQSELLGEVDTFVKSERWFNEGIAHTWGSPASTLVAMQLDDFTQTIGAPATIKTYAQAMALWAVKGNEYSFMEYSGYSTVMDYMQVKLGVTNTDLINVIRQNKNNDFETSFNSVMAAKGLSLTLDDLEDPTYIQTEIINGWLKGYQTSGSIVSDVKAQLLYIENDDYLSGGIEALVDYDNGYFEARLETFKDGAYDMYVLDDADKTYGPVKLTVKDKTTGDIDLSGIKLCTTSFCTEDG